jgi:hypothetical protein
MSDLNEEKGPEQTPGGLSDQQFSAGVAPDSGSDEQHSETRANSEAFSATGEISPFQTTRTSLNSKSTSPRLEVSPFQITRTILYSMFASPRLVQRMIHAEWIHATRRGKPGREALFDYGSAQDAYRRYRSGEEPPLLPCELASRTSTSTSTDTRQ